MGCLTAFIKLTFIPLQFVFEAFIWLITFLFMIIKGIIKLIIKIIENKKTKENNKYDWQYLTPKQNIKEENPQKKNITNSLSYLKIYIDKKYKGLIKKDELNYKLLDIESYDAPYVYYDEFAEVKEYNVFEAAECSAEKYGNLLQKIHKHCRSDFYATIRYDKDKVEYRITIKEDKIFINGNNIQYMKNRYTSLKNKITSFADNLLEYFIYIDDDNFYYDVVPNDDLDCDSITTLSDKLKETNDILLFEIPYMEEISTIIDIIEPKIIKKYKEGQERVFNSLPKIETIEEESIYNSKRTNNKKEKELSWREKDFKKEADLWGLSEEDRRLAKEEGMTPAEFIEAEEYDDDELLLDEWER